LELEQKIKNAKIISDKKASARLGKAVAIGSTVTVRNKTDRDEPEQFTIVGSTEADPMEHRISNESPIGKALLDSKKGDNLEVLTPSGIIRYEVLKVS